MTENTTAVAPTFEKGTWGAALQQAVALKERSTKDNKRSGTLLWTGAKGAINEWAQDAATDPEAEDLYANLLDIMGTKRRGDASKIGAVARAVAGHGLDLEDFDSLSKAYAAARALTQTAPQDAADDSVADDVTSSIDAPKTASTAEAAAKVLLSKGVDGAVVAIFDALTSATGDDTDKAEAAIRSFLRAATTEAADRVKARTEAAKEAAKEAKTAEREAARAEKVANKPKATVKPASEKVEKQEAAPKQTPKAAPKKARPKPVQPPAEEAPAEEAPARPKPVTRTRPKPVKRA